MRVLDLFSGIGGFSLGLERAGMQTVAFCEIEEFCRKVLKKHWPDVPIFEDVKKLRGDDLGTIDIICGGYPCQPFSLAGERRGEDDDRHLWPEMFRLLQETRARWLVGENVAGHISMGLDEVLSDLEGAGYAAQAFVVPAVAADAPHRRDRVWIVANAEGQRQQPGWRRSDAALQRANRAQNTDDGSSEAAPDTRCERLEERNGLGSRSATGERAHAATAPHKRWPTEPAVGRVANGIPRRVDRLRALGNAVVPQIPEMIGRAIMAVEELENTGDSRCSENAARF
jgi:DNA (cytosine-5)-methyltransferase 1